MTECDPRSYSQVDMQERFCLSLQSVYLHDRYLIEMGIRECAISHRLAVYLEGHFRGWHVDCEYNKVGNSPKMGATSQESKRPDIIIHRRGEGGPNLLAVEVKKSCEINESDQEKCRRYILELKYNWAVCVSVDRANAIWQWSSINGPTRVFSLPTGYVV